MIISKSFEDHIHTDYILYDATRLINRRATPVATGIDRIDLDFALGLAKSYPERVIFVAKLGTDGVIIEHELVIRLLETLQLAWCGGGRWDQDLSHELERRGLVEHTERQRNFGRARHVAKKKIKSALRPKLLQYLKKRLAGKTATYIVCSHQGFAGTPGFLRRMQSALNLRVIAYIHDIIPIEYPEYIRPQQIGLFANYLSEITVVNGKFICNSKNTATRLQLYAEKRAWQVQPIDVIYPKIQLPKFKERQPEPLIKNIIRSPLPYFVTLGTIEPRKNHLLLLHLWRELALSDIEVIPHLHIVGKRGWENENIIDLLDRCETIHPHITEHSNLDDANLFHLLQGACALLFPSFAEGLGLPLIEASKLGVPVIAADLPVYKELKNDGVILLDPLDGPGWRRECLAAIE